MVAVALENYEVNILDCDTRAIIRKFVGHKAPITDCCFSPDSRWLITASMDSTIRVWDIPSSYLIDHFRLENACISLSMSPSGDFLATAHNDYLGVFLWSNKMLFDHVTLRSIDPNSEPPTLELISLRSQQQLEVATIEEEEDPEMLGEELNRAYASPDQLDEELFTMSESVATRWQTLLNLDVIKKRNRPKVPLKKEKNVPFFLPTVAGLELKFDVPVWNENMDSKVIVPVDFDNLTTFGKLLNESLEDYCAPIEALMKMGPSKVDFEIKSMAVDAAGSIKLLDKFMKMLIQMLKSKKDFEIVQTYVAVFLREHGSELVKHKSLRLHLEQLEHQNSLGWQRLEQKLMYGIGVVSALRNYVK